MNIKSALTILAERPFNRCAVPMGHAWEDQSFPRPPTFQRWLLALTGTTRRQARSALRARNVTRPSRQPARRDLGRQDLLSSLLPHRPLPEGVSFFVTPRVNLTRCFGCFALNISVKWNGDEDDVLFSERDRVKMPDVIE